LNYTFERSGHKKVFWGFVFIKSIQTKAFIIKTIAACFDSAVTVGDRSSQWHVYIVIICVLKKILSRSAIKASNFGFQVNFEIF
jgi:hypothetical protein